jgi:hypothetical protein
MDTDCPSEGIARRVLLSNVLREDKATAVPTPTEGNSPYFTMAFANIWRRATKGDIEPLVGLHSDELKVCFVPKSDGFRDVSC